MKKVLTSRIFFNAIILGSLIVALTSGWRLG